MINKLQNIEYGQKIIYHSHDAKTRDGRHIRKPSSEVMEVVRELIKQKRITICQKLVMRVPDHPKDGVGFFDHIAIGIKRFHETI